MIQHCSYCDKPFTALRKDKQYCSHSCKQMAFFKRQDSSMGFTLAKRQIPKTSNGQNVKPSSNTLPIDIEKLREELYAFAETAIENKLKELIQIQNVNRTNQANQQNVKSDSIATETKTVNKEHETSIEKTVKPSSNPSSKILDGSDRKETSISKTISPTILLDEKEEVVYVPIRCKWIDRFYEQIEERGNDTWLKLLPPDKEKKIEWISIHYRCLLECILTISDIKAVEWNDLAEVCNAFIFLTEISYFKELPNDYPYISEIAILRDKLKHFCLETQEQEWVQFRLKFDTKIDLMLQRYELAASFSKISFNQSQLDFKEEHDKQITKLKEERKAQQPTEERPWQKRRRELK